ncbi:MAG TPA: hypothetical protein VJ766_09180, partial [Pseudoxanthomonas sp.]|nr:hypothetical protein [Pseudoxanthomonas sp.]
RAVWMLGSRTFMTVRWAVALALILMVACVGESRAQMTVQEQRFALMASIGGFRSHHPDIRWRYLALSSYRKGRYDKAARRFRKAAHYADKPAQAMLAEMYWSGIGVPRDRPLAYAWMDLAAEREYPDFVEFRKRYWAQMTEAEQERALQVGKQLRHDYSDAVAKRRTELEMRRGRRFVTGSRTGFIGLLDIQATTYDGRPVQLRGDQYYADEYWKPFAYWRLQDQIWRAPIRERVTVGDPETMKDSPKQ